MDDVPIERTPPSSESDAKLVESQQRLSQQQNSGTGEESFIANNLDKGARADIRGLLGATSAPIGPSEMLTPSATPKAATGADARAQALAGSEQGVASMPTLAPGKDQTSSGSPADGAAARTTPTVRTLTPDVSPSRVPGTSDQLTTGNRGSATNNLPSADAAKPIESPRTKTAENVGYQPGSPESYASGRVGDSGIAKMRVEAPAAPVTTITGPLTYTTNESGQVKVSKPNALEAGPVATGPVMDRSLASRSLPQDGGQPRTNIAAETQPRPSSSGEYAGGVNRVSPVPERVNPGVSALERNTGFAAESNNLTRQSSAPVENQNQVKLANLPSDTQARSSAGASPDAGSRDVAARDAAGRDVAARDGSARTAAGAGGSALDSQGRPILGGADKLSPSADSRQQTANAEPRLLGPQGALETQGKQSAAGAQNDSFGTRRETGLQMPDTKQSSGRTDSGVQLPDTKQSSGRTDTGGTQMPDARNNTGRNDANAAKMPDAKTLANLDQKFGDKLNPPGKGGGVPIAIPGIPDILGGLRGDKDSKTVKDGKADSQGAKDGAVRNEAPGGRDAKDAKGEPQGPKDSKVVDGKGDTKSGADDKSIAGQKGARPESDSTTKGPDGKAVQDVRTTTQDNKAGADGRSVDGRGQGGSNLVHDGGIKSDGTKSEGSKSDGIKSDGIKSDGAKSDGSHGGRADGAERGTERVPGAADKGLGDKAISDRGHTDVGAGGKAVGSRGDGPFVLPPGSLPVPDLVGGIKNIGQQIDGRTNKFDSGKGIAAKTDVTKGDSSKSDGGKGDLKGMIVDGVKTIVTGGLRPGDKPTVPGEGKVAEGVKPIGVDGVKTAATDGVKTIVTGGLAAGDGVKNAVAGGAKGGDGVRVVGAADTSADGKQIAGKNPVGSKLDGAIIVPPAAVPLTEMIGNLKGIAARIFPPECRSGRPDAFDNSLPGRKTERLEDRSPSALGAGARAESTIPIVRAIGERVGKVDEQFIIKAPQFVIDANKVAQSKIETVPSTPPWIAPEHAHSEKLLPGLKATDTNAAKPNDVKLSVFIESRLVKNDVQPNSARSGEHQVSDADADDRAMHDEAAERLLVNLELVGSVESKAAVESDEEEAFPLAVIEYFGDEFEKSISNEEEVSFDGDGHVVDDDEQSTRYQYIVEAGDTIELIAIKVFKNVTLAPLIYEINKDEIPIGMQDGHMVFTLKVGTVIWLPFPKEIKGYLELNHGS